FTDNLNNNLIPAPAAGALPFGRAAQISGGRTGLFNSKPNDITFHAPECPGKGATKVHVKGSVTVIVGKDEKEVEKKDDAVKTGVELEFGSLKPPPGGFSSTRTTLLAYEGTKPIASITVLDANGKELPSRFTSTYRPTSPADRASSRATISISEKNVE